MSKRFTAFGRRIERFGFTALGFCAAIGLLCLLRGAPVQAQPPGVNMTALYNQVQALQTTVNSQATKITALQAQTKYITTGTDENGYPATFITSCNVWVQDGSGSTFDGTNPNPNGLGNLIIGYNELGQGNPNGDVRTGSHNLIVGYGNSYNSWGGVAFGWLNTASGYIAAVTGGYDNTASGNFSTVSGGQGNTASNSYSTVAGGQACIAGGTGSSVTGGHFNRALGAGDSVNGGQQNTANSGGASTVCGGYNNGAYGGFASTVSGGENNISSGTHSSVSGGVNNTANANNSSVSGGYNCLASGDTGSVTGGYSNTANAFNSTVSGGQFNLASGFCATVGGGGSVAQGAAQGWSGGSYHTP